MNLILCDGATLNASVGISIGAGNTLNIYAQSGGTGTLTAAGNGESGIGGVTGEAGGTVTIHGGTVTANGGSNAQGIGQGEDASSGSGTLTVYGGTTANPTTVITDYATNRPQYMKVAPPSMPAVSYVEMTFDAATSQVTSAEKSTSKYTLVSPDILTWSNDAWYVVSGSVQLSSITVTGSANLILRDGATLTASG